MTLNDRSWCRIMEKLLNFQLKCEDRICGNIQVNVPPHFSFVALDYAKTWQIFNMFPNNKLINLLVESSHLAFTNNILRKIFYMEKHSTFKTVKRKKSNVIRLKSNPYGFFSLNNLFIEIKIRISCLNNYKTICTQQKVGIISVG